MKASAIQLANQIINDNKEYIEGNIANYMLDCLYSNDQEIFQFLTDQEIEDYHNGEDLSKCLIEEVKEMFLTYFDFDIDEFEYHTSF